MKPVTIGTRGSKLALWQARWIEQQLKDRNIPTRIEIIKTTGDKITDVALAKLGSETGLKGVFTKEIEEALIGGSIDLAVHSLKDLPTELDSRLAVRIIPKRADPRDALAGMTLAELPKGARVGTSSLRRAAQMRRLRPDVEVAGIRGNIDTRLRKLDEGRYDAILVAAAGLHRLGWQDRIAQILEPNLMLPAVGQGALGIETRAGDDAINELLSPLDDPETRIAVTAERALLAALGGGCQMPLGAHTVLEGDQLTLLGVVLGQDGKQAVRTAVTGEAGAPEALGQAAAAQLLEKGARDLIGAVAGGAER